MRAWGWVASPELPRPPLGAWGGPAAPAEQAPEAPRCFAGLAGGGRGSVGLAEQGCATRRARSRCPGPATDLPGDPRHFLPPASEPGCFFVRGETLAAVPLRPVGPATRGCGWARGLCSDPADSRLPRRLSHLSPWPFSAWTASSSPPPKMTLCTASRRSWTAFCCRSSCQSKLGQSGAGVGRGTAACLGMVGSRGSRLCPLPK